MDHGPVLYKMPTCVNSAVVPIKCYPAMTILHLHIYILQGLRSFSKTGHNQVHQSPKRRGVTLLSNEDKMTKVGEATKIGYEFAMTIEGLLLRLVCGLGLDDLRQRALTPSIANSRHQGDVLPAHVTRKLKHFNVGSGLDNIIHKILRSRRVYGKSAKGRDLGEILHKLDAIL
jgi:hypothetical protein